MSITSKSPKAVLLTAHRIAAETLPAYSHVNSPRKFTQHQLFACLALKAMLKLDYRGLSALLTDAPELGRAIGMEQVPHYTCFQKAAARLLGDEAAARLLDATVRGGGTPVGSPPVEAAIDSTGLRTRHASEHFTRRRKASGADGPHTKFHDFPKLGLVCDRRTHEVLAWLIGRGPRPDVDGFRGPLAEAHARRPLGHVAADAGYDSEANHAFAREVLGVETAIPCGIGRPSARPPVGRYRRLMKESLDKTRYGQRWQVETVMSMIKRRLGDAAWSRSDAGQARDLRLLALTHNILIP